MPEDNEIERKVVSLLSDVDPPEKSKIPVKGLWATAAAFALVLAVVVAFAIASKPSRSDIRGAITFPSSGAQLSSRILTITGYTENVPPEYPYILVAVDVPKFGKFWPKKPFIKPNTRFQISFSEGGPDGLCTISLYMVSQNDYEKISDWFENGLFGGLRIPHDRYRLHSVKVII